MAFDTFLKIESPDLKGESTAKDFADQMEIFSFSWGASNPVTVGSSTGGMSGGKVSVSSFNIMKKTDKASPELFMACCTGKHYGKATVSLRKAGGKQEVYLTYTFTEVMVESVQWSGSSGGDDVPTESVSLAFGKVEISYKAQKPDGTLDSSAVKGQWDLTKVTNE
ncbi:MAG TPA: type VI secretion system tube protein Hcp [Pirellulales bacterium]|nr:type VI secretion system tube protein Hcp [Pirellulales bacterium]